MDRPQRVRRQPSPPQAGAEQPAAQRARNQAERDRAAVDEPISYAEVGASLEAAATADRPKPTTSTSKSDPPDHMVGACQIRGNRSVDSLSALLATVEGTGCKTVPVKRVRRCVGQVTVRQCERTSCMGSVRRTTSADNSALSTVRAVRRRLITRSSGRLRRDRSCAVPDPLVLVVVGARDLLSGSDYGSEVLAHTRD